MRLEIESAANFLLNFLRLQPNCLTGDQLEVFRETINKLLTTHYQQHWFPEKPVRGSGYRCLRINHKMDPIIAKAGTSCGLNEKLLRGFLPKELTLWVDPKEVSYRIGENGSICVLFNGDCDKSAIKSDSQDSGNTKVQQPQRIKQQTQIRTKVSSPDRSLSPSSTSSFSSSSSANSSLSNSPTSSLDWSHNIESRRSPVSTRNNQMASPRSARSMAASLPSSPPATNTTGSDVTGFVRSGFSLYETDLTTGHHHRQQQQQQQRQGRNTIEKNWNWTSSYINGSYQQQAQQQQHFHYGRQPSPLHGRNPSPPLTHHNFNGWNNYALDHTFNYRNHRFNANYEPLATYVSS